MIDDAVNDALEQIATTRSRGGGGVAQARRIALRENRGVLLCYLDGHDHRPRPRKKYRTRSWTCPRCQMSFLAELGCVYGGCTWVWISC